MEEKNLKNQYNSVLSHLHVDDSVYKKYQVRDKSKSKSPTPIKWKDIQENTKDVRHELE